MNNTLTLAVTDNSLIRRRGEDLQVSAFQPAEMASANAALIEWCDRKIAQVSAEAQELADAAAHAVIRKWKASTLQSHHKLALKRVEFYRKIKSALCHGYYIVPNFPVTFFAIRTNAKSPQSMTDTNRWSRKEQEARLLAEGEGEYKNPFPVIYEMDVTNEKQRQEGETVKKYFAEEFADIEFPVNMAKPEVMEATSRAMAFKLFDAIGVLPDPRRKADPVIVGRLFDPRRAARFQKTNSGVSFIIGWHLDTATL